MLFMIIEHFKNGDPAPVYKRFLEHGRMLPERLNYVESWVDANFTKCFQLMETDEPATLREWMAKWEDLVDFQVVSVVRSSEIAAAMPFNR